MTYQQTVNKIHSFLRFGSRPGLGRITKLLQLLGNPHKGLSCVHVAGTNGKGSVCAMLSSILKNAGHKTGLFISPYVVDFRERIQINGCMIPETQLCEITAQVLPFVEEMAKQNEIITEFELITAIAFLCFKRQNCDVVVLETGLGGRFDSTNVIQTPLCSVITSIGLDHTAVLGSTMEQIAFEKSGIIKPHGNTVFYPQQQSVNAVIERAVTEQKNTLFYADKVPLSPLESTIKGTILDYNGQRLLLPLIGRHQIKNAKTALQTLQVLQKTGISISASSIADGFSQVFLPARMELLSSRPVVLLDGSHNPDGLSALADVIRTYLPNKKAVCIMGMLRDKDSISSLSHISGLFSTLITLTPQNPRALPAQTLAQEAKTCFPNTIAMEDPAQAIEKALSLAGADGAVVCCGSLYLAAQLRPVLLKTVNRN